MNKCFYNLINLFVIFFKIGLFTFGGGYGMISIIKDECIKKRHWISDEDFINLIAVAESTPGPIAVNFATYIGYKRNKIIGSIFATIGVILPSIIIIYIISLFFNAFLSFKYVSYAFSGIRIAVALIIIITSYNLISIEKKSSNNKSLTIFLFLLYAITLFLLSYFSIKINSVYFIFLSIILAVILCFINDMKGYLRGKS